jgi:SAM-dependent methyltransferase
MTTEEILGRVERYYSEKIEAHGPTAQGVDWNSAESQRLRFEQLLRVCEPSAGFAINDYGCGYGALADFLQLKGLSFSYFGFDISKQMIAKAEELHRGLDHCRFSSNREVLSPADYTVASGVFNVKLQATNEEWKGYMLRAVGDLDTLSIKGFAFNALTKYSDSERMQDDLYYADPLFWFDHCKRHFSKAVALLHDYPLFEFTVLVRK